MDEPNYNAAFSEAYNRHGDGPYAMYVCADSTLTYARYGDAKGKIIPVAMPVGRVASVEQAEAIIAMIGQRPYDFADGDASYVKRAEKVAERTGHTTGQVACSTGSPSRVTPLPLLSISSC